MTEKDRIGIIFCDPPAGHERMDMTEIIYYARDNLKIPVIIEQSRYLFSDFRVLLETIQHHALTAIILAGINPGRYLNITRTAMLESGKPARVVVMADFGDGWNILNNENQKACKVIENAFQRIAVHSNNYEKLNPDTLVLGGGIAGIQASLEIANAGLKVYLVEKSGTIGGHMAMFDKTFPTLDCAACILTPKMVEVGQQPNIELLTYSELVAVKGEPGDYQVTLRKKARMVNLKTCIGCGTCAEKCPAKVVSEFDSGTSLRKAIYIPFPQAVPNKYLIDAAHCRYVQEQKCGVCAKVCPVEDCINFDEQDEFIDVQVGQIIVATGFQTFDAKRAGQYGYGEYPNVLTSLEFERLINASGPTGGFIVPRSQDKKGNWIFTKIDSEPKRLGIVHCVGSRDENYNAHCSKVCCMYSLKLAHLVKEKLPDAEVFEYYIDMRAFGKGYEEFYNRIREEGIHIIRGRTAQVNQVNGHLIMRTEDVLGGQILEQEVDMVVLSVGLEPHESNQELANSLGIELDATGWFQERHAVFQPVNTLSPGIRIAGACQGPKDIPDTVAQASAAAAGIIQNILSGRINNPTMQFSDETILETLI